MTDSIKSALDELLAAFPPYPLDPGRMFEEGRARGYPNSPEFEEGARGKRWDELPIRFLEFHHDAIVYLGPEALVEVIPAYLSTAVRRDRGLDMLPTFVRGELNRNREPKRFDSLVGRLTPPQQQAIWHALEAWAASLEDSHVQLDVIEVLESYWRTTRSES